jgi:FdhD protein
MSLLADRRSTMSWRNGALAASVRPLAEETPIAFTYDGATHAVMMGTPGDLEDFAVGFSFSENLVDRVSDIESLDIQESDDGVELRMWLSPARRRHYARRRLAMAGPTGCGLCGIESLEQAVPKLPPVTREARMTPASLLAALDALASGQALHRETRSVHAAALWNCDAGRLMAIREDVGRHNALDKIVGHAHRATLDLESAAIVMTSRVSVELVQKTARLGVPILVAISAPTILAVRTAEAAGITLVGVARGSEFDVFTHGHRICTPVRRAEKEHA